MGIRVGRATNLFTIVMRMVQSKSIGVRTLARCSRDPGNWVILGSKHPQTMACGALNVTGEILQWTLFNVGETHGALGLILLAVHLAAWKTSVPSDIESLLWRASAIVMGSGLSINAIFGKAIVGCYHWLCAYFHGGRFAHDRGLIPIAELVDDVKNALFFIYLMLFILVYIAARVYLVLECFFQLRAVPIGVYAATGINPRHSTRLTSSRFHGQTAYLTSDCHARTGSTEQF
jgi:hypothetical protein